MVDKPAEPSDPPLGEEQIDRPTAPPTSHVAANESGRKKDWVQLLEKAARATGDEGADLPAICQEARPIAEHVGELSLQGFSLLSAADRREIIEAATERFFRESARILSLGESPERLFHHAIRCEVVALIERRLDATFGGAPAQNDGALDLHVLRWLLAARRRVETLKRLQRRVFCLTIALDSVSPVIGDDEKQERVLTFLIGVALGLRVNSVHQHQVRIRKRLFAGPSDAPDAPDAPDVDPAHALRYLWAPPFELACAALAYRAAHQQRASQRLYGEQKEYSLRLKAFKEASERARRAWRALVAALDASAVKPRGVHATLVRWCEDLGIDDRVCKPKRGERAGEAKHLAQTWGDLLLDDDMRRPIGPERDAWRRFLFEHVPDLEVEARFLAFEGSSVEADHERIAVARAYRSLLDAAHELKDIVHTITNLLDLVGAERSGSDRGGQS